MQKRAVSALYHKLCSAPEMFVNDGLGINNYFAKFFSGFANKVFVIFGFEFIGNRLSGKELNFF